MTIVAPSLEIAVLVLGAHGVLQAVLDVGLDGHGSGTVPSKPQSRNRHAL